MNLIGEPHEAQTGIVPAKIWGFNSPLPLLGAGLNDWPGPGIKFELVIHGGLICGFGKVRGGILIWAE